MKELATRTVMGADGIERPVLCTACGSEMFHAWKRLQIDWTPLLPQSFRVATCASCGHAEIYSLGSEGRKGLVDQILALSFFAATLVTLAILW